MNVLDILKINDYVDLKCGNEYAKDNRTYHEHVCDFVLLKHIFHKNNDWVKRKCKAYLKKYGKKFNYDMCDECPHMRYVWVDKEDFILSVTTSGISSERNFYNKEMINDLNQGDNDGQLQME